MKQPICAVCHKWGKCKLVRFANYKPLDENINDDNHPEGLEWFCDKHITCARKLMYLNSYNAILKITSCDCC